MNPCWTNSTSKPFSIGISPPDPQHEYSPGQVLLAARLCQPTALVNVAGWAAKSGADIFANLPADKLNDDRLGRALDAFLEQSHSVLGGITAQALQMIGLPLGRLHFDPTDVVLYGAYEFSTPAKLSIECGPGMGPSDSTSVLM